MKQELVIKGMHCKSCEMLIKDALEDTGAVANVIASHQSGIVKLDFDASKISIEKIRSIIKSEGYEVVR